MISSFELKVTNICAKFNTNCKLDLKEILNNDQFIIFKSKKYLPNKFSGLIAKLYDSNTTLLIFQSGAIIIVGGKCMSDLENTAYDFVFLLNMLSLAQASVKDFKITNICASTDIKSRIDLTNLYANRIRKCSFEPEIFIHMKYKVNGKILTITHKGKIFGTGFKNFDEMNQTFKIAYKEIEPYLIKE